MKERELSKYEALLIPILREKLKEESFIGTMLALVVDQEDWDDNCKQMYEFLQEHPDATHEEIRDKQDKILGIE